MTNEAANIKNGKWEFKFAAEEGTILILAQFGPNLYTWSKRDGLDPRQSLTGGSNGQMYSPIRTFSGGINITF